MIVAVGVDAVAIARIRSLYERAGERFVQRLFTADEASYCSARHHPAESFAARFAAKEAAMKCLGTGWADGTAFREIEVRRSAQGAPELSLHGPTAARAAALGIRRWHVSLTHTDATATAFVIAES